MVEREPCVRVMVRHPASRCFPPRPKEICLPERLSGRLCIVGFGHAGQAADPPSFARRTEIGMCRPAHQPRRYIVCFGPERQSFCRCEVQTRWVPPDFPDDPTQVCAAQAFFHCPQHVLCSTDVHMDNIVYIWQSCQTWSAGFASCDPVLYPQQRFAARVQLPHDKARGSPIDRCICKNLSKRCLLSVLIGLSQPFERLRRGCLERRALHGGSGSSHLFTICSILSRCFRQTHLPLVPWHLLSKVLSQTLCICWESAFMSDTRRQIRHIFDAGVTAANPYAAVSKSLSQIAPPTQIIAIGKAAVQMARAALDAFAGVPTRVVTNYENAVDLEGATVMAAGHPVPDENGAAAARAVLADLSACNGPVLALISGGGSALLPAPVEGVQLAEKAALNSILLGAGLDITQMNLIRQQVSEIKGGGLLAAAAPHAVTALILSDVVGDDMSTIASGPTAPPLGTAAQAVAVLQAAEVWGDVPASIQTHLLRNRENPALPAHQNILVGSNGQSVDAMHAAAPGAKVLPPVEGDVADAARAICDAASEGVTIWGGETTVQLKGTGRGGRNQELALRIALEARARGWTDWTCLQGGSDGRDGPTDAAGGLVDQGTLARIAQAGGDLAALLANNDSYAALSLAGDLLMTEATGTNVADLGVLIRAG